jgi:hypothetical protein
MWHHSAKGVGRQRLLLPDHSLSVMRSARSNIAALGPIDHKPTARCLLPPHPADEWAYARLYTSDAERCTEFPAWLHTYYHCGHTALGGQPPATRVPNLSGQYI